MLQFFEIKIYLVEKGDKTTTKSTHMRRKNYRIHQFTSELILKSCSKSHSKNQNSKFHSIVRKLMYVMMGLNVILKVLSRIYFQN